MTVVVDLLTVGYYLQPMEPAVHGHSGGAQRGLFQRFVVANRRLSRLVEQYLPQARTNPSAVFSRIVAERVRQLGYGAVVLDVGAGRRSVLAGWPRAGMRLIAVDSSWDELRENRDADERLLADVCCGIPLSDQSVDMIISRHVMEHLPNAAAFVSESARLLRPDGCYVHFFSCRFALFSILNRLLPRSWTSPILRTTMPGDGESERFAARYHSCWPSAFCRLLRQAGLTVDFSHLSYYGSHYLGFLFPAYLLSVTLEIAMMSLRTTHLCAYLVVAGRRKG